MYHKIEERQFHAAIMRIEALISIILSHRSCILTQIRGFLVFDKSASNTTDLRIPQEAEPDPQLHPMAALIVIPRSNLNLPIYVSRNFP